MPSREAPHFFGECALGPTAFPHRLSAMDNPAAPISHHWLDSTFTAGRVTVANLVAAINDLLALERLREVDIFGCGRGALVACELAAARPKEVRRLIIAGGQQPATPPSQPTLILDEDAALALSGRAEPVVAQIRAFLDQAS